MAGFFFNEDAATPESIASRRLLLNALQRENTSAAPVGHWTQALARALGSAADNYESAKLSSTEKKLTDENKALFMAAFGSVPGSTPQTPAAATPAAAGPVAGGAAGPSASLINSESGGNWQAQNNAMGAGGKPGHFGRLQFGQARLQDAINAGAIPAGTTPQAFMASPDLQRRAEQWHFADIDRAIASGPAASQIGKTINGIPVTQEGLRAVAHLGGVGGMNKFVQSGGAYNPADANGTTLMAYLQRHGGQGGAAAPAAAPAAPAPARAGPQAPGFNPTLLAALSSPWASKNPALAQVATAMLTQQMGKNPVQEQLLRLQLQAAQRDADMPKTIVIKRNGEDVTQVWNPATRAFEDPPGYSSVSNQQTYRMPDGREIPLPANPEARKTMLADLGKESAKSVTGAPDAVSKLSNGIKTINELIGSPDGKVKEHPGFQHMFGWNRYLPAAPGGSWLDAGRADAEALVEQLKSQAFLNSVKEMQGMGALSNAEGAKIEGAVARLSTKQSPKAFRDGLREVQLDLERGLRKAQTIANNGRAPAAAPSAEPSPDQGGWTEIAPGIRIREAR